MNELAQNIILQGEENRPLPTGVTFRQASKTQNIIQTSVVDPYWFQCRSGSSFFISIRIRIQGAKPKRIIVRL
jgi:hypothetical protein